MIRIKKEDVPKRRSKRINDAIRTDRYIQSLSSNDGPFKSRSKAILQAFRTNRPLSGI